MCKEEQSIFPGTTAVCRRTSEQKKGQSGVKDTGWGKLAGVWGKRRMSSASVMSEGIEELGALQVKKMGLLPSGKTCQTLQWKRQELQGSEKWQSLSMRGEVNTEIMLPATIPCNDLLRILCLYLDGGQTQA